ncbi:MAG TPA: hypothetical protein VFE86_03600 [Ilumatobacteraceae bacterium]|nr:hypothetical protein [Ilumatobacteraceae bacterium]
MAAALPTAAQMAALLAQWNDWLSARTDTMLSLEDRVRTAGSDTERADLAAAFVARKAVADRLEEISDLTQRDAAGAAALANEPLVDTLGASVGANLSDAAALIDAIVDRVESHVATVERQSATDVELATRADADLAIAERLAQQLGSHVNRAAQLRSDLSSRRDLAAVAGRAAALRSELESIDEERRQLFATWAELPDRLGALSDSEASLRQLAERCRDKIANPPTLAIPSVAAVESLPETVDLQSMPWPAARSTMSPLIAKVQRLDAALAEARRRFQQPLSERDDLRGLLQSFRDKAGAHGLGEDSDLEPLYRRAEEVLWAAPCDLAAARPLVDEYVAAVNAKITSRVSPGGLGA